MDRHGNDVADTNFNIVAAARTHINLGCLIRLDEANVNFHIEDGIKQFVSHKPLCAAGLAIVHQSNETRLMSDTAKTLTLTPNELCHQIFEAAASLIALDMIKKRPGLSFIEREIETHEASGAAEVGNTNVEYALARWLLEDPSTAAKEFDRTRETRTWGRQVAEVVAAHPAVARQVRAEGGEAVLAAVSQIQTNYLAGMAAPSTPARG